MKKYTAVFSILCMIIFSLPVLAEDLDRTYIFDAEEYQQEIRPAADQDVLLSETELLLTDEDAARAYRVYTVRSEELRDTLKNEGDVFRIISRDYFWVCPKEQQELLFIQEEGKWRCSASISFDAGHSDVIENALVEERIYEITAREGNLVRPVIYIGAGRYATYFAYFETKAGAYFIPFAARPEFTGLENGKVYKGSEMISILEEKYPLPDLTEIDPSVMGGPAYSEEPEITAYLYQNEKENRGSAWSWIAIAAGLAVLAAGAVILVRKKHIR